MIGRATNWDVTTSYNQIFRALTLADHLIALGNNERIELNQYYQQPLNKISIIYNGIADAFFDAKSDLFDATRILIRLCVKWSLQHALPEWRLHKHNLSKFKGGYRKLQKLKHSTSKNEDIKAAKELEIKQAYQNYIDLAGFYLERTKTSMLTLKTDFQIPEVLLTDLRTFSLHAERQIDQIRRRAIQGETIPHDEKVFSLFQPHTEWISKGKAGVSVELGLRVCIMEDSHGFILPSQVCQNTTDDKVAVPMVKATQAKFSGFKACSFDKGFHSPANQTDLKTLIEQVVLPKKGKLSKADQEREYAPEFKPAKKQHSR